MFELSIALKYLVPRKKHLSVTLIALMSTGVIALVVWLLLVFLSVTEGMESSWLKKLTDLNAPIRITPTEKYYSSYYYKADALSSRSNFSLKTLGEKLQTGTSDPYDAEEDMEPPFAFPEPHLDETGTLIDPVKKLQSCLDQLDGIYYQDYELSGATLKLQMARPSPRGVTTHFLTQATYLATPPSSKQVLSSLEVAPSAEDIDHLVHLSSPALSSINIHTVEAIPTTLALPIESLPVNSSFTAYAVMRDNDISHLLIPSSAKEETALTGSKTLSFVKGTLKTLPDRSALFVYEQKELPIAPYETFSFTQNQLFSVENTSYVNGRTLFEARSKLQGKSLELSLFSSEVKTKEFSLVTPIKAPKDATGILLPKSFRSNGALIGDTGFLSYTSSTAGALQEQRMKIFVEGFYDPGILPIGSRCLLVPKSITRAINTANVKTSFDKIDLNGFQVWFQDLNKAPIIKEKIKTLLENEGVSDYFKVTSFEEYDFAKELFTQFQSDKYLFSLVGVIILLVASCNILSLLVILVSDKKREIAILQSMGASKKSIGSVFAVCGVIIGSFGALLGTVAALFTLKHIDALVRFLSMIQGRDAFQEAFYGSTLPSSLSSHSVLFVMILIPTLSLFAGLIPAMKAAKVHPSSVLRGDT